ncbi:hypothetical protein N7539_007544 [Penicillium diatomitis]|uniref:Uncharacterized protein n=1 Tax=Penicillium diatomitis TaxID=2819901 RepID=A0A9W9WVQ3_9EURO|nr:uncharacterized protein N7539_007544 [Penicillium diatomitis]KAJ5477400.1 hypothetical protein N7539_007544 [Penicillium diatomitis]
MMLVVVVAATRRKRLGESVKREQELVTDAIGGGESNAEDSQEETEEVPRPKEMEKRLVGGGWTRTGQKV